MANLGAKLKGMNWKEFFINNCEKMGLGVISLCALLALAKTSWGTYKTEPDEFMKKVTQGKTQFQNGRWPEDRKSEFVARDLGDVVSGVLDGIPASNNYQIPAPFYPRIWTPKEPLSEPKYLRFEHLIADGSRVLLQLEADQPGGSAMGVEVAKADDSPRTGNTPAEDDNVEKPRQQTATGNGPNVTPMPMPMGVPLSPSAGSPMPGYGESTMAAATNNAQGYRFAAVRAVFPMKEQLAAIRTAMRLESPEQALEFVRFQDFELERQTAVAGPNPWAGKWEKIDIETALRVLSKAQFDYDVVDQRYRDAVFTMPLPLRVTSDWKRLASHPQIKRLLTDEEAARQEAKNRAAIEVAERMKKMQGQPPGGFGGIQHDISSYQRQIQSGDANMMQMYDQASNQYQQELTGGPGMTPPGMQPGMMPPGMANMGGRNPLVQIPDLLLFRYLDFDVDPGNAYRYRVRLVFKNPLFQRDTSELKQPESAAGEFRYSEWSDPTTPIAIEDDMQVFLAKVNPNPSNITAEFDAFQWMTETGSLVKAQFNNANKKSIGRGEQIAAFVTEETSGKNIGAKIGGIEADVLKPAQMTYGKEKIEYVTPNIVIDIASTPVINPEDFPDLELTNKKVTTRFDHAVVVNKYGEIVELDNLSQKSAHSRADNQIKTQEENFKDYRKNSQAAATSPMGLEGLISPMPGMEGMMPPGMEGGPTKRRSMTKKGGAGMYGSASGPGGAPGMAPPGGGHSASPQPGGMRAPAGGGSGQSSGHSGK